MTIPLSALDQPDPYTNELPGAERTTLHVPDERCRWVAKHPVAVCGYITSPGIPVGAGGRSVQKYRPPTAAELQAMPTVLAQPEPPAPWETQL